MHASTAKSHQPGSSKASAVRGRYKEVSEVSTKLTALVTENRTLYDSEGTSAPWDAYCLYVDGITLEGIIQGIHCRCGYLCVCWTWAVVANVLFLSGHIAYGQLRELTIPLIDCTPTIVHYCC